MIVALASPRIASSLDDGLARARRLVGEAADRHARIVCFPEAYLPGLRGQDFAVGPWTTADESRAMQEVSAIARDHDIAIVMGLEHIVEEGRQIASVVFDASGEIIGQQAKVQLDPTEEPNYVPGRGRRLFELEGLRFGISICHEGWRYPETVRWSAVRGAHIVFHPQLTGSDHTGVHLEHFASEAGPYYEKAMLCRSIENSIWFASINYALRFQESATAFIDPDGRLHAAMPYGEEGVLACDLDLDRATGFLASRYAPERHGDAATA